MSKLDKKIFGPQGVDTRRNEIDINPDRGTQNKYQEQRNHLLTCA